ncbi:hypothetical protein D3C72_1985490 [compost metagenome]
MGARAGVNAAHRLTQRGGLYRFKALDGVVVTRQQRVPLPAGNKHDIPGGETVLAAVLATKNGRAHGQVMEVGMLWLRGKSKPKARPGLNASVLDAVQPHAGQQFADQVGGLG